MNMIETSHLTKSYGKSRGIIDLDLTVQGGDFFGFIGPNGAGKSTTIRTLLGLIEATEGSAMIMGKDITKNRNEILSNIGYMPSEAMFYNKMRVSEVIKMSASLHNKNCEEEAARICESLQLDVKKRVEELSLGNRKKVSIVCALQHEPELYILDEPTSGLDPLMQQEFFRLLKERQSHGATIVFSSHVLSEVQRYCNRAAIIREGRLIACDSVDKLANTNASMVCLHGVIEPPAILGVKNVSKGDTSVSFLYQGDIKKLIAAVNELSITDMTITEPELEEIFIHYYERKEEQ